MSKEKVPYKGALAKKKQVRKMFDSISGTYDKTNRLISFGIDQKWRKKVIEIVLGSGAHSVLDVATGTGDLAISFAEKSDTIKVVGVDISEGMLEIGKEKVAAKRLEDRIDLQIADSEGLPFDDNIFDASTVAFGVRNFENPEKGLSEIHRVLKPGGILAILETSVPTKTPFKQGYNFYTKTLLPLIGQITSGDRNAYQYLSKSASVFPHGEKFNNILRKIGFTNVKDMPQTFGSASIYTARK